MIPLLLEQKNEAHYTDFDRDGLYNWLPSITGGLLPFDYQLSYP